ncbi:MAG: HAMP domain-containing histidine kinase [Clostridia bacterium]|nr:HAMP domain-containing histidine kinase [Clostridia bacterium]
MKHAKRPRLDAGAAKAQASFALICSLCVFVILVITFLIFSAGTLIMQYSGLSEYVDNTSAIPFIFCAIASFVVGFSITPLILRIPTGPVNRLISSMRRLASGHFEERIDLGDSTLGRELTDSFNTLASELQNTELLRSDFINSFSHEFKTPMVSIRGFARILLRDEQNPDSQEALTHEQREAYLSAIVDESTRLTNMATNVLHLTKVENQQILTDVTEFNLSEQLRRCILLLEKAWSAKNLTIVTDFSEFSIRASEELLGQVWLNLLDNAVKYTPQDGRITVRIYTRAELLRARSSLQVDVINTGSPLTPEQQKRVFDKFWQGDTSHASAGAGVGLSIVRKIVELHGGTVTVGSDPQETTFSVVLPIRR